MVHVVIQYTPMRLGGGVSKHLNKTIIYFKGLIGAFQGEIYDMIICQNTYMYLRPLAPRAVPDRPTSGP